VSDGKLGQVVALLDAGQDPNTRDNSGWTPLHFAAQMNQLEIAQILISRGASVDAQDCNGNSPLARAVFSSCGKGGMIGLLRRNGANPNLMNNYGVSPLKLAMQIANYDVKRFFADLVDQTN
jgi:uncharacterized protein